MFLILSLTILALPSLPAQGGDPADVEPYRERAGLILRGALAEGRAWPMLEELCTVAPLRLSGSPGAERAVQWALEAMRAAGLENVRAEPCKVPHWERGSRAELAVLPASAEGAAEPLRILALGGSVATPEAGLTAAVVEVKSLDELAALGERARGRIVFFNRPMDPALLDTFAAYGGAVDQRTRGASAAAKAGGVAAIVRSMTTRLDDFPHAGAMRYEEGVERVPAVAVSTLGAERLAGLLRERPDLRVRLALDCRTHEDVESANVVGELRGAERPEEVVLLGAHLDAWDVGQGASDDGAGCVQVIEAARLIAASGAKPRRTIRVVLFANEENGLRGAFAYAETHADELEHHVLALESDRGGFVPRGFVSDANPAAMRSLRSLAGLLAEAGAGEVRECGPGQGGADVWPLSRAGVITAGLLPDPQRYFDVHHCARDTLEQVSPRELALGAGVIGALAYGVANLPERLPANDPAGNAGR